FDVTRSIVDAAGNFTTIVSDDFGRTTTLRDPARGDNTFTYNAFGETTSHTDGNGALKEYFYDDLGRLERIEDTDGVTLFTYDGTGANAIGRLVSATSPDGHTTTLSYMPPETDRNRGLLESIQRTFQGETFTQTVEYDADSRVTALHYPTSAGS